MNTRIAFRQNNLPTPGPLPQVFLALVGGVALFFILLVMLLIGFDMAHAGQIYPGVSVAGVDLGGLTTEQAAARLGEAIQYQQTGRIVFQLGGQVWVARPVEVGLYLDAQTSAAAAFQVGRSGNPIRRIADKFNAWFRGANTAPLLIYDQRAAYRYLETIAAQVNLPTVEASLSVNGTDVVVKPGQVGRSVDIEASLAPLESQLRSLKDGILPVAMTETPPVILDASAQAEIARKILSAPLTISLPGRKEGDPGPWTFDQQALAGMLIIQRVENEQGATYQVGINAETLRSLLLETAPKVSRIPENARFIFNDETRKLEVIEPAVIGRALNIDQSIEAVNQKAAAGEHNIELVLDITNPQVGDDATAEQLGIRELVSVQTSYFYGSSDSRIQNIKTAASRFHGILVPPGAVFSMSDTMGDVSLDSGYAEALIIFGNRTIKGVGGGVCQVSTTLFRTVFFGGYPIVERHSHAYRVSYYELNRAGNVDTDLAGLDATVFVPVVDFKFTNDTPNWLLMETYINVPARTLTWKFYSTSLGRRVDWETTGLQNVEPAPDPLYQENPDLGVGEIRQVDWEAAGADVTIYRTVYQGEEIYIQDQFSTHYQPWQAVYEYGPGTKIPKKYRQDN